MKTGERFFGSPEGMHFSNLQYPVLTRSGRLTSCSPPRSHQRVVASRSLQTTRHAALPVSGIRFIPGYGVLYEQLHGFDLVGAALFEYMYIVDQFREIFFCTLLLLVLVIRLETIDIAFSPVSRAKLSRVSPMWYLHPNSPSLVLANGVTGRFLATRGR